MVSGLQVIHRERIELVHPGRQGRTLRAGTALKATYCTLMPAQGNDGAWKTGKGHGVATLVSIRTTACA